MLNWKSDGRLREENRKLRKELASAKLENELLAQVNENLRRWLLANTAAAVALANAMGAPK